jgi:hypothetical protein
MLLILWSTTQPELLSIGLFNIVLITVGELMYPKHRLGSIELASSNENLGRAIVFGVGCGVGLAVSQVLIMSLIAGSLIPFSFMSVEAFMMTFSAGVTESYFIHWGIQTNISTYAGSIIGVFGSTGVAVVLHMLRYGTHGGGLLIIAVGFLIMCSIFEYTKTLDSSMIGHILANVL